jgi:nucleoside-diphosphate-sugar epimerase
MNILITGGSGFIGTNLVEHYRGLGHAVRNIDIAPPRNPAHQGLWRQGDITRPASLEAALGGFSPQRVVHLAARTDLQEKRYLDGYDANIAGVRNVVRLCAGMPALERVLFASSMLVCRNGYRPRHDLDYCPDTLYGSSKVMGERIVRDAVELAGRWAILRPTSIWGPWFGAPYRTFFLTIARGRYVQPRGVAIRKALGYVGNSVRQIASLLEGPESVCGGVFYLADYPDYRIDEWAGCIQRTLQAPRILNVPLLLLQLGAAAGDWLNASGWVEPPLTRFRLRNMLTASSFDMSRLQSLSGPLPFDLENAVRRTVDWLYEQGLVEPNATVSITPAAAPSLGANAVAKAE